MMAAASSTTVPNPTWGRFQCLPAPLGASLAPCLQVPGPGGAAVHPVCSVPGCTTTRPSTATRFTDCDCFVCSAHPVQPEGHCPACGTPSRWTATATSKRIAWQTAAWLFTAPQRTKAPLLATPPKEGDAGTSPAPPTWFAARLLPAWDCAWEHEDNKKTKGGTHPPVVCQATLLRHNGLQAKDMHPTARFLRCAEPACLRPVCGAHVEARGLCATCGAPGCPAHPLTRATKDGPLLCASHSDRLRTTQIVLRDLLSTEPTAHRRALQHLRGACRSATHAIAGRPCRCGVTRPCRDCLLVCPCCALPCCTECLLQEYDEWMQDGTAEEVAPDDIRCAACADVAEVQEALEKAARHAASVRTVEGSVVLATATKQR